MKHVIWLGFLALVVAAALSDGPSKASRIPCHLVAPTQSASTESLDVWIESLRRQHNVPAMEAIVFRADTILARGISGVRRSNSKEQQSQRKCSQIGYSAPDPTLQLYRLSHLEGQAVYAGPEQKWELGSANGVCVVIFDRKSKLQIASATTDDKGQFEFANIEPGIYTLVASAGDLQVISIPVELRVRNVESQRLLLHLRDKQDKRKSYVSRVKHAALRKELLRMVGEDQNIRNEMIKSGADNPSKDITMRMELIDRKNTSRMKSIIKEFGWPRTELVGWDGSEAAFFIVQHSDHLTQKELQPILEKEFRTGNLSGPNYALFTDRVLVEDGRPQIYGLRARPMNEWTAGEPVLYPIEDEANVDKRRAEIGLGPLSEYREKLKQMYRPD